MSHVLGDETVAFGIQWKLLYYNRGYIGLYWGYIGIMEKKMETTIMGLYIGLYRVIVQEPFFNFRFRF